MEENMFSIGDRVECLVNCPDGNSRITVGSIGTVCYVMYGHDEGYRSICVEWDDFVDGHDCLGHATYGYGWDVRLCDIRVFEYDEDTNDDAAMSHTFSEDDFKSLLLEAAALASS